MRRLMASETETLSLHLVRALHKATGGQPQRWEPSVSDESTFCLQCWRASIFLTDKGASCRLL